MLRAKLNVSRTFVVVGFFLGVAFFVAANLYSYQLAEPPCCDRSISFGIPFPLAETGGYFGGTRFIVPGVIADVIAALVASVVFAWLFAKSLRLMGDRFQQAVRWHLKTRSQ